MKFWHHDSRDAQIKQESVESSVYPLRGFEMPMRNKHNTFIYKQSYEMTYKDRKLLK